MTNDETVDLVTRLADVARAKGINAIGAGSVHIEMGPAPAPPEATLTADQREAKAKADEVDVKRQRLRRALGRTPTDEEIEAYP